ncbi:hypothetical protein C8R45DRAFT_955248 [Mycena sanguinolenta]|nr:hypothetical protein C8R45DRAFT_955248 [Mycena sanguinolenta]
MLKYALGILCSSRMLVCTVNTFRLSSLAPGNPAWRYFLSASSYWVPDRLEGSIQNCIRLKLHRIVSYSQL